jgi:hypothetical protein
MKFSIEAIKVKAAWYYIVGAFIVGFLFGSMR